MSSAAILFAENRYKQQVFFPRKKIFNEKKSLADFFPEVKKPCAEISSENENCGFPQKCGEMEALHSP